MEPESQRLKLVFAARAIGDLFSIFGYISKRNPAGAQRVEDSIRQSCEALLDFPFASSATDEPSIRRLPVVKYPFTIFYRVDLIRGRLEVVRVVRSGRVKSLHRLPD